jgi:DNA polymerase III subunit alpha
VGRALGMPLARVNEVTAMVPEELGITLDKALEKSEDLRKTYESDGEIRELLDLARKIEGLARNVGTHAAAVVIADKPLTEYVPLAARDLRQGRHHHAVVDGRRRSGRPAEDGLPRPAQPDDPRARRRTDRADDGPRSIRSSSRWTTSRDVRAAAARRDQGHLPAGKRRHPRPAAADEARPFRDIIATNALYRPGPLEGGMVDDYVDVKHGRKQAEYKHPVMKEVLEETHGVMVYQEQVMRILNRLGGIELANAYTCIKAISKKKLNR